MGSWLGSSSETNAGPQTEIPGAEHLPVQPIEPGHIAPLGAPGTRTEDLLPYSTPGGEGCFRARAENEAVG